MATARRTTTTTSRKIVVKSSGGTSASSSGTRPCNICHGTGRVPKSNGRRKSR